MTGIKLSKRQVAKRAEMGEVVGGGYFVFRRGKTTGRIAKGTTVPFEHRSFASALEEAQRLAGKYPGEKFTVFREVLSVTDEVFPFNVPFVENVEQPAQQEATT